MMTTLPVSIVGARFLGSRDRIAIAGTVSSSTTEVRVLGLGLGAATAGVSNGDMEYTTSGSVGLAGTCTAMELCGIPRVAKLLVAVATSTSSSSLVSFVDTGGNIAEHNNYSGLQINSVIKEKENCINSACTAMSFDNFSANIALLRDTGSVETINIETGKIYAQLVPDGAGVLDIRFSNAGKLLTLGRSARGQIQVWDVRSNGTGGGESVAGGYSRIHAVRLPSAEYTCITPHETQDHYMYCGDTAGYVHKIDFRTAGITHSFKAHNGPVSGIVQGCHDDGTPTLLTSCRDGSVASTSQQWEGTQSEKKTLLQESAAISSIDFDYASKFALMTSSVGGMWVSSVSHQS